jgi:hypothetical protein
MHKQSVRRVVMGVRRDATEREAAEHFKGQRFFAGIANAHPTGKDWHIPLPRKLMFAAQSRGMLERGDDARAAVFLVNLLTDEFESLRRVPRPHGATLGKRSAVDVLHALELHEGVPCPRTHRLPHCRQTNNFHIRRQELAVFHRRERLGMKRELRRTLAFSGCVKTDDRVADGEFGEEFSHEKMCVFLALASRMPEAKVNYWQNSNLNFA